MVPSLIISVTVLIFVPSNPSISMILTCPTLRITNPTFLYAYSLGTIIDLIVLESLFSLLTEEGNTLKKYF